MPLVCVVIPTTRRPALVVRAVRSVLAQTLTDLELIVVVDGPNLETVAALATIADPRLRVLQNEHATGAGAARNRGASAGTAPWLAFLDDDDEWLPEKLERQLAVAGPDILVSCRAHVLTPGGRYTWPTRPYDGHEPVDDYLFDRRSAFRGATMLNTSSFLLSRPLFERTQFGTTAQNEDNTLLLRVAKQAGGRVVMLADPLMRLHKESTADSLGSSFDWRDMLAWADANRPLLSPRAYAGFCLVYLASQAARHGDLSAIPVLLSRAVRHGRPRLTHLLLFASFWLLPIRLRRRVRAAATLRRAHA